MGGIGSAGRRDLPESGRGRLFGRLHSDPDGKRLLVPSGRANRGVEKRPEVPASRGRSGAGGSSPPAPGARSPSFLTRTAPFQNVQSADLSTGRGVRGVTWGLPPQRPHDKARESKEKAGEAEEKGTTQVRPPRGPAPMDKLVRATGVKGVTWLNAEQKGKPPCASQPSHCHLRVAALAPQTRLVRNDRGESGLGPSWFHVEAAARPRWFPWKRTEAAEG